MTFDFPWVRYLEDKVSWKSLGSLPYYLLSGVTWPFWADTLCCASSLFQQIQCGPDFVFGDAPKRNSFYSTCLTRRNRYISLEN
jgi:hypothetical protein